MIINLSEPITRFEDLRGRTITKIERDGDEALAFTLSNGVRCLMNHAQDCCESVYIKDVNGELDDLLNSSVLQAEEVSNREPQEGQAYDESFTWTFYKLATANGYATICWYGSSNGYYSKSVDFSVID